jgi:hypothetical protein
VCDSAENSSRRLNKAVGVMGRRADPVLLLLLSFVLFSGNSICSCLVFLHILSLLFLKLGLVLQPTKGSTV